jgi:hypothetical protein
MNDFFVLSDGKQLTVPQAFEGYVIFFRKSKEENVAVTQMGLMQKLIENGLKLSLDSFLFVDLNQASLRISEIQKKMTIKKCFLFGVKESEIGINFDVNAYQLTTVSEIQFLKADAPEVLDSDKNLKNKLWTQLQISFNITK